MTLNRFYPTVSQISAITNDVKALVTTTEDHDFTVGEIVSFRVSKDFGMYEINRRQAKVLSKTDDTITIDIDTSTWNTFTLANLDTPGTSPPLCVPSSSGVIPYEEDPTVNIEDAFDNRRV